MFASVPLLGCGLALLPGADGADVDAVEGVAPARAWFRFPVSQPAECPATAASPWLCSEGAVLGFIACNAGVATCGKACGSGISRVEGAGAFARSVGVVDGCVARRGVATLGSGAGRSASGTSRDCNGTSTRGCASVGRSCGGDVGGSSKRGSGSGVSVTTSGWSGSGIASAEACAGGWVESDADAIAGGCAAVLAGLVAGFADGCVEGLRCSGASPCFAPPPGVSGVPSPMYSTCTIVLARRRRRDADAHRRQPQQQHEQDEVHQQRGRERDDAVAALVVAGGMPLLPPQRGEGLPVVEQRAARRRSREFSAEEDRDERVGGRAAHRADAFAHRREYAGATPAGIRPRARIGGANTTANAGVRAVPKSARRR